MYDGRPAEYTAGHIHLIVALLSAPPPRIPTAAKLMV